MKILNLFTILLFSISSFAARDLPSSLKDNWQEKTVFFGVNKAWDYLKQERTTLSYLARDEVFDFENFSQEKYWQGLKEARTLGLKFAGISNWKISKKSIEKRGPQEILIKIEGTYKVSRGIVQFTEWQYFVDEQYHQVTLLQDGNAYHPVPPKDVPLLFRPILGFDKKGGTSQ